MGKLAFEDVPRVYRDVSVTEARARWKEKHTKVSEREIRMLRFIWMRHLTWEDRNKLHGGTFGALLRKGLAWTNPDRSKKIYTVDPRKVEGY